MRISIEHRLAGLRCVVLPVLLCVLTAACGHEDASNGTPRPAPTGGHPLLGDATEVIRDGSGRLAAPPPGRARGVLSAFRPPQGDQDGIGVLTIDYPFDESVFPPEFVPPTFLWHDGAEAADTWVALFEFSGDGAGEIRAIVPGPPPPAGEIDERAIGPTNEPYEPTEYQASASSWTPTGPVWEEIKRRSVEAPAKITFYGLSASAPEKVLSSGTMRLRTSKDPVGAPIFYRDVPLMPAVGEEGRIQPLGRQAIPIIAWRLRDVSLPESRVVLTDMPTCANCHSFSRDGSTFGMDVDGPDGDKGVYALLPVSGEMSIKYEDVITWNSFPDKPDGHRTIGFLSRVSPTGRFVLSTVNEELYVRNFESHEFLQVFYPTRGILAFYDRRVGRMKGLPGADDPEYVHCSPVWMPNEKSIVFARARARDAYPKGQPLAEFAGDPNELPIQFDLYRMPFRAGFGGEPEPIVGASQNGMSNTFPKISPDGKWIVFVKCKNGQLMRPDGKLWIVPVEGGEAREMECNLPLMNSWHSFSPNSRWMVWSSKSFTPYTQMFLTHLDAEGRSSPAILIPDSTAANRAVNIPEFLNAGYDDLRAIDVPAVRHHKLFWKAEALVRAKRYQEAVPLFRGALEADPTFDKGLVALAQSLLQSGQAKPAVQLLEQALVDHPEDPSLLNSLANAHLQMEQFERAKEFAQRVLDADPQEIDANNTMGGIFASQEEWAEAARFFRRALASDPAFLAARKNLGIALLNLRDYEDALRELAAVVEADPDDPNAQKSLAAVHFRLGSDIEAIVHLERAAALDEGDLSLRAALARHLATNSDPAVRDGTRAVMHAEMLHEATGGRDPVALDVLAAAYAEAGQFDRAVEMSERAVDLAARPDGRADAEELRAHLELFQSRKPLRIAPER